MSKKKHYVWKQGDHIMFCFLKFDSRVLGLTWIRERGCGRKFICFQQHKVNQNKKVHINWLKNEHLKQFVDCFDSFVLLN